MANQLIIDRALDSNGYIAPGAKATVYADGTTTLVDVYSDTSGTVAAANPIVADADGFWPQRFVIEVAKIVVTDADDTALYTMDPVPVSQGTASAASGVSFAPSVEVPEANVQDAIDYVATLAASGFAAFGLGITGNATLLANLDATTTGAGIYRFDGTSTGTFPSGVVAGDTGMIELWRQTGATAMMELHHATTNRVFRRRLTATVWEAWREEVNVDQATVEGDLVYRGAADFKRLAKGIAGQSLMMNSGLTAPEWGFSGFPSAQFHYETAAAPANFASPATFTALNLTTTDKSGLNITLASNQLTFGTAGTYFAKAVVPYSNFTGGARAAAIRLQNVTSAALAVMGAGASTANGDCGTILVSGEFTVSANDKIELQGVCGGASLANGSNHGFGTANIHNIIQIWRVS